MSSSEQMTFLFDECTVPDDQMAQADPEAIQAKRSNLFREAAKMTILHGRCNPTFLMRRLAVSFVDACNIINQLEAAHIICACATGYKVIMQEEEFLNNCT